jgi:biopolymer transport protein ExbD
MKQRSGSIGRGIVKRRDPLAGRTAVMLTPLVDMFTIMLTFLLMNYSTGGQLTYMMQSILMPESLSQEQLELAVEVAVGTDKIYVDGEVVMDDLTEWKETDKLLIPALYEDLKAKSIKYKNMEQQVPFYRFNGKATIQADKVIPFRFLKKVLYTADRADFPNISLAVFKKD